MWQFLLEQMWRTEARMGSGVRVWAVCGRGMLSHPPLTVQDEKQVPPTPTVTGHEHTSPPDSIGKNWVVRAAGLWGSSRK